MRKYLRKILSAIICVIFILHLTISVNADAAITDNEISAINALNGHYVCSINNAYQERYFKANVIKNLNREVEVISLGSSHFMTLSKNAVKSDYINLSLGGANLQDRLNILGLLDLYNVRYKKVIYEIDLATFLPDARKSEKYNVDFKMYGDYFCKKILGGVDNVRPALDFNSKYVNEFADNFVWDLTKVYDVNNLSDQSVYYRPDASQYYPKALYDKDRGAKDAQNQDMIAHDKALHDLTINEDSKKVLDALMKYFYDNGIDVTIVVVPRSPYVYDKSDMISSTFVYNINNLIYKYYTDYNVCVCGSFNPHDMNIKDEDYYDSIHVVPDKMLELYTITAW